MRQNSFPGRVYTLHRKRDKKKEISNKCDDIIKMKKEVYVHMTVFKIGR